MKKNFHSDFPEIDFTKYMKVNFLTAFNPDGVTLAAIPLEDLDKGETDLIKYAIDVVMTTCVRYNIERDYRYSIIQIDNKIVILVDMSQEFTELSFKLALESYYNQTKETKVVWCANKECQWLVKKDLVTDCLNYYRKFPN